MSVVVLAAALVGAAYGYVAQRGAFCMNSGFAAVAKRGDTSKFKAFVLAVAVQALLLPLVFAAGVAAPTLPALYPVGAVAGGLLFGVSMRWAAGCAAGVWHKVGAGSGAALFSVAGMALGAAALEIGPLRGLRATVQSWGAGWAPDLSGMPAFVAPLVGVALLALLARAAPGHAGDWSWRRTGLLIGLVGVAAWTLSGLAGRDFGMAVVPGSVTLISEPASAFSSWDVLFVLGIPAGALVAARGMPRSTSAPLSYGPALRRLIGGIGLGAGASLAAGCTVGHGLVGLPLLAPGSVLTVGSILAGRALVR